MFSEKWKQEFFTIPNFLSAIRIALIPIYITIYFCAEKPQHYHIAGAIVLISCLTDLADGMIARKYHLITNVGKILDPLADKLTQLALIFSISLKHSCMHPVLFLFLIKEVCQTGVFLLFIRKGKVLSGALQAGKICTTVLFLSLFLLLIFPDLPVNTVLFISVIDTCFLIYSFYCYMTEYFIRKNYLTEFKPKS